MEIVESVNLTKLKIKFVKKRSAKLDDILFYTLQYLNIDEIISYSNNLINVKARFFFMTFADIYAKETQKNISVVVDRDRTSLISGRKRCFNKFDLKNEFECFENYMVQKMNIKKRTISNMGTVKKIKMEKETPNRTEALKWWKKNNLEDQFYITIKHNYLIKGDKTRHPETLTENEIELIYNESYRQLNLF